MDRLTTGDGDTEWNLSSETHSPKSLTTEVRTRIMAILFDSALSNDNYKTLLGILASKRVW
jgi:hypothetical protein